MACLQLMPGQAGHFHFCPACPTCRDTHSSKTLKNVVKSGVFTGTFRDMAGHLSRLSRHDKSGPSGTHPYKGVPLSRRLSRSRVGVG
jgi:hypothetical protein